jgi:outer membrane murein-binding lipoprotein Lpp
MAMRERDSLEPYEPSDPGYDWDYEAEEQPRNLPNILWGRVAVLGAVVLLAFLIGRMTAGGGGVAQERFDEARADLQTAQDEISTLESDLQQTQRDLEAAQQANAADTNAPTDTQEDDGEEDPAANPDSEVHTVVPGDTFTTIAEEYYGDAGLADYIMEANQITDPTQLSVGSDIIIPPEP